MREIFHGWRRKAEVFTLVVACVVMLECFLERVQCEREALRRIQCINNLRWPPRPPQSYDEILREQRLIAYAGFSYVPHVFVAMSLALFSAYLLLWKPRKQVNHDA